MAQSECWPDNTEHQVAAFMIFCRTTEVSSQHFEARVFVVPAGEIEAQLATRSECRIFESAELASSECVRMAEAMKSRLSACGHDVIRVQAASVAGKLDDLTQAVAAWGAAH